MVLEGSVSLQTVPCQSSIIIKPYGIPSKTLFDFGDLLPQTYKENPAIHLHPESMWYIFCPPPEPIPYRKLYIPIDPAAPPKPRLPPWLKKHNLTGVPGVLRRALGRLKITAWMLKIGDEIISAAVKKFEETGNRINHRKIRREFRRRVSAVKKERGTQKQSMILEEKGELNLDDIVLDPKEWGEGRFDEINRKNAERRARKELEEKLAAEAAAKALAADPTRTVYKKGSGKFK